MNSVRKFRELEERVENFRFFPPLGELSELIRDINKFNGFSVLGVDEWSDEYKIPAILALIHSEVSEALEAFREDDVEHFIEELADVFIRLLDCTEAFPCDFMCFILEKMKKNLSRGVRHGGKRI